VRHGFNDRIESGYRKGEERRAKIIFAARDLLIDSGYHNFSLRRVAQSAGISVGNLQYYFPTKQSLTTALLQDVIEEYLEEFEEMRSEGKPEQQFLKIVRLVFEDLQDRATTVFFPELWSLANHEPGVTEQLDAMYNRYREVLAEVIHDINPKLTSDQARKLAVFISASMEGHTMFVGFEKPMANELEDYIAMASAGFLHLIKKPPIA